MRRFRQLAAAAAVGAVAAAVSAGAALSGSGQPAAIAVEAKEFLYEVKGKVPVVKARSGPAKMVVGAGPVLFRVTNSGVIEHNFVVWDPQQRTVGEIPVLSAGETQELQLTLPPGTYLIVCTYPGHKELGMQLELEVH